MLSPGYQAGRWIVSCLIATATLGINSESQADQVDIQNACADAVIKAVRIHRSVSGIAHERTWAAPTDVVIVAGDHALQLADLAALYAKQQVSARAKSHVAGPVTVLALGPLLDAGDNAAIREATCKDGLISIGIAHTKVSTGDINLRRNVVWKPLLEARLSLAAGRSRLQITWSPVNSVDGGTLDLPPLTQSVILTVN